MSTQLRFLTLLAVCGVVLSGCGQMSPQIDNPVLAGAGDVAVGEELFASNCAQCHGPDADGSDQGPSFLNDIYIPSHHADGAFLIAVRNGVQPHHWDFGPMPPRPGLTDQDVADIVAWVRQQQRDASVLE